MSRKLMNLASMYTAITAYASEYPFSPPSPRLGTSNGNIPSDKQKCQPKAQHEFIIKGVNGEFYPCKPDIFDKTYEEVTE